VTSAIRPFLSTASFVRLPLRTGFRHLAESGYEGVEIMVTHDPATQEPHLLAQAAREFDVKIEAIHAPFLLITRRVWGSDPIGKIYRAVQVAERSLAEFSARTGVTVAVENMFPVGGERGVTFHADQELEDLDGYPYLVLDTSHAAVSGIDILDAYRRYRDKLVHVHLSNNAGKGWDSHLPVYDGVLPLDRFLELLASEGYRGTMSIELDLRPYLEDDKALREVLVRNREFCETHLPAPERTGA